MKSILSLIPLGPGHQRCPSFDQQINTSNEETARPNSSETKEKLQNNNNSDSIVVPKPRKPNPAVWTYWMNYLRISNALVSNLPALLNSSSDSAGEAGVQSDGCSKMSEENANRSQGEIPRKYSKEERALKIQKYIEKKKKKTFNKKIRYHYRQQLADKRLRFQGRFVKAEQAKDLILKGEAISAKDSTELFHLFEEDKTKVLQNKFQENIKSQQCKPIFKTVKEGPMRDRISSYESFSSASIDRKSTNISPLLEAMNDINKLNQSDTNKELPINMNLFKL